MKLVKVCIVFVLALVGFSAFSGVTALAGLIGDVNSDGRIDQTDVAALQTALSGGSSFWCPECDIIPYYKNEADLAKPCGIINEKDLKALIKAVRKIEKGKRAPKSKCHGKQRVGMALNITRDGSDIQNAQLKIYNIFGELIYRVEEFHPFYRWQWDMRDQFGSRVPNGVYLVVITVRDLDGYPIRREVRKIMVLR